MLEGEETTGVQRKAHIARIYNGWTIAASSKGCVNPSRKVYPTNGDLGVRLPFFLSCNAATYANIVRG
eukprot:1172651-Prorocentrum_minimum.AAC.1